MDGIGESEVKMEVEIGTKRQVKSTLRAQRQSKRAMMQILPGQQHDAFESSQARLRLLPVVLACRDGIPSVDSDVV